MKIKLYKPDNTARQYPQITPNETKIVQLQTIKEKYCNPSKKKHNFIFFISFNLLA